MNSASLASISLEEYYQMLQSHDWLYAFTDDQRVYEKGSKSYKEIFRISSQSKAHGYLFLKFKEHHFSGKPWATEKYPLPTLNEAKLFSLLPNQ